jgi:hypothetical protein
MQRPIRSAVALLVLTIAGCTGSGPTTGAENLGQTEAIGKYLKENFGYPGFETSWYGSITGVSVRANTVVVNTNLSSADARAQSVCEAASGYIFSHENRSLGIESVQVIGANGAVLIYRRGVTGRCS